MAGSNNKAGSMRRRGGGKLGKATGDGRQARAAFRNRQSNARADRRTVAMGGGRG